MTDLQSTALRNLACIDILELRESSHRRRFHDCIRSAGHRIEFDGKHGRSRQIPELPGAEFCLPPDLVGLDLLVVLSFIAQYIF